MVDTGSSAATVGCDNIGAAAFVYVATGSDRICAGLFVSCLTVAVKSCLCFDTGTEGAAVGDNFVITGTLVDGKTNVSVAKQ